MRVHWSRPAAAAAPPTKEHHGSPAGTTVAWNDVDRSAQTKCASPLCLCGNQSSGNWAVPADSLLFHFSFDSARGLRVDAEWMGDGCSHGSSTTAAQTQQASSAPGGPGGGRDGRKEREEKKTWHYRTLDWFNQSLSWVLCSMCVRLCVCESRGVRARSNNWCERQSAVSASVEIEPLTLADLVLRSPSSNAL